MLVDVRRTSFTFGVPFTTDTHLLPQDPPGPALILSWGHITTTAAPHSGGRRPSAILTKSALRSQRSAHLRKYQLTLEEPAVGPWAFSLKPFIQQNSPDSASNVRGPSPALVWLPPLLCPHRQCLDLPSLRGKEACTVAIQFTF